MRIDKTSNPAFSPYFWPNRKPADKKMTISGIVIKSFFCIAIIAFVTVCIWKLYTTGFDISWFIHGGLIGAIIISVVLSYYRRLAPLLVPLYAIAKGCFLGGISSYAHAKFPNMPYQAIGVTIITFFTILFLYQTRIIVVTKKLQSVIITACSSIFMVYIVSWILSFFGVKSFVWGTSWIAIGFNIIAAIFASLTLLLDFKYIEKQKHKAPKSKEWFATWGLLVSLVWLYVEILRLMKKFAIRF
ncbi:MAG: Bax inhibitor-1/YccA family protein [Oceanihabitans sp.]